MSEGIFGKTFGEIVGALILASNFHTFNVLALVVKMGPKEMPLYTPVLGSTGNLL